MVQMHAPLSTDHQALRACASRHFASLPTSRRLFSRLKMTRFCRCGARLDVFSHQQYACSRVAS